VELEDLDPLLQRVQEAQHRGHLQIFHLVLFFHKEFGMLAVILLVLVMVIFEYMEQMDLEWKAQVTL
jgi:hypothetical protein